MRTPETKAGGQKAGIPEVLRGKFFRSHPLDSLNALQNVACSPNVENLTL